MNIKLKGEKIGYSDTELEVLKLLSKKEISSAEIIDKHYSRGPRPFHARSIINGLLRSLSAKMEMNNEAVRLVKSKRNGPHPSRYWIEKQT